MYDFLGCNDAGRAPDSITIVLHSYYTAIACRDTPLIHYVTGSDTVMVCRCNYDWDQRRSTIKSLVFDSAVELYGASLSLQIPHYN